MFDADPKEEARSVVETVSLNLDEEWSAEREK